MTKYELQGRDRFNNWDAGHVTWDTRGTLFDTEAEAQSELEYWINEKVWRREDLRIVEIETPDVN